MKFFYTLLFVSFALQSCAQKAAVVEPKVFAEGLIKENVQVLDVRTSGEFDKGHIKNALQANWNDQTEFKTRTQHLDKEKPLYLYCQAGGRSAQANSYFVKEGFKSVVELKGGMIAWKEAKQAVEGKSEEAQMTKADYDKLIIDSTKTYIVDFGATWCPPCIKQKPILDQLKKEHGNKFVLINIDGGVHTDLKKELNVINFPTIIIYKNAKETKRFEGLTTNDVLAKELL